MVFLVINTCGKGGNNNKEKSLKEEKRGNKNNEGNKEGR